MILKIGLLEPSEVETDPLKTDRKSYRRKQYIKYRYLVSYLSNKKEFLKSTVRMAFDTDHGFCLSVHPYARTDKKYK